MALLRGVIGLVLRRARLAQGKTLRDVAVAARVSVQYLSEVERGLKEASSEVLAAICAALGWQLVDLLDAVRAELVAELTSNLTPAGATPDVRATGQVRLAA
jgi:transcriptional regulator with XRE-family HTH domain